MTEIINETVKNACDIALGESPAPADSSPHNVRAAHKDYNSRGRQRAHWFRLVLRNGTWGYFAERRGGWGRRRCATVYGNVYHGELVCEHDLGEQVGSVYLVSDGFDDKPLRRLDFQKIRSGDLRVTLPDGRTVDVPNPRS